MVRWQEWEYWPVSNQFEVQDPTSERPGFWTSGVRSIEATVETLLALNLMRIVGFPLRLVRRAFPIDPSADIVATDILRRVHLFELKKGSVSGQAAAQLEQYLLKHVFGDADRFLTEGADQGQQQITTHQVARDIMGVSANERSGIVGYRKIRHELGDDHALIKRKDGKRLSSYGYGKLMGDDKLRLIHAALDVHARKRSLSPLPPFDQVERTAEAWSQKLSGQAEPPSSVLQAERRLVLWLVGASISPDALEQVRRWRRSGIDARVLRITGRSDGKRWVLGVRREAAPQRDQAENEVLERAADLTRAPTRVKLVFYNEQAASSHMRHGGELLDDPIVKLR